MRLETDAIPTERILWVDQMTRTFQAKRRVIPLDGLLTAQAKDVRPIDGWEFSPAEDTDVREEEMAEVVQKFPEHR